MIQALTVCDIAGTASTEPRPFVPLARVFPSPVKPLYSIRAALPPATPPPFVESPLVRGSPGP
jgi:hypothetical protein